MQKDDMQWAGCHGKSKIKLLDIAGPLLTQLVASLNSCLFTLKATMHSKLVHLIKYVRGWRNFWFLPQ